MELSTKQLQEVRETIARDWKYPDMQIGITGHIKYRIQDLMTDDPKMYLDDAIAVARAEFGDRDFKVFEDGIKLSAKMKYGKLFWQTLPTNFQVKYIAIGVVAMLWAYLFFVDVQPPKLGLWGSAFTGGIAIYPQLLISGSMAAKSARPYKWYYTLAMSKLVLYPWALILGVWMMLATFSLGFLMDDRNFAGAGFLAGFTLTLILLMVRTGYIVRKAALEDCRLIEAQLP